MKGRTGGWIDKRTDGLMAAMMFGQIDKPMDKQHHLKLLVNEPNRPKPLAFQRESFWAKHFQNSEQEYISSRTCLGRGGIHWSVDWSRL